MIKQRLRDWLGVQELSNKIAIIDKRTRVPKAKKPPHVSELPLTMKLVDADGLVITAEPQIVKGYSGQSPE